MSQILELADQSVHDLAKEIIERFHPDLKPKKDNPESGIRLCIFMASNSDKESDEPAVKLNGYPCYAIIGIIPYKQRVDKRADAEITIDEEAWKDMTETRQRALLDHEITHLEVVRDKNGFLKTDDAGRPKLKMRLHDWQLGGFRVICQRYPEDALEMIEATKFRETFGDVAMPTKAGQQLSLAGS